MKNLVVLGGVALLALSACSDADKSQTPAAENTVEAARSTGPKSIDGGPSAGTFEVTSADGRVLTQTTSGDGKITTTDADGKVVQGTYTEDPPRRLCITNEGDTEARCYMQMIDAQGVWTAVNEIDPKDSWTIHRIG